MNLTKSIRYHTCILLALTVLTACGGGSEKPVEVNQAATTPAASDDQRAYMKVRKLDAVFEDVRDDINTSITELGIKINNVSHIGDMLNRTAKDVGATKTVYAAAEAIEFCSATVSRATMEADPHNIIFCPYIISIYSLNDDPEHTYVAYRRPLPVGTAESKASLIAVEDLLEKIIISATE